MNKKRLYRIVKNIVDDDVYGRNIEKWHIEKKYWNFFWFYYPWYGDFFYTLEGAEKYIDSIGLGGKTTIVKEYEVIT